MSNASSEMEQVPHPQIVSHGEWEIQRKRLLAEEKELTKHLDRVNAMRRRQPMVKIEKEYRFDGPAGERALLDLFQGERQLIVYHFMFDPDWEKGCPGCTRLIDGLGDRSLLKERNTSFVAISRAPFEKLQRYRAERQWDIDWYSSFRSSFNYDFHVSLDSSVVPLQHNFRTQEELEARRTTEPYFLEGETHGLSVFFRLDDQVFRSYSTYARGCEGLSDAYSLLDRTPYGRQEDFEDSPMGWPQQPTYG